MMCFTLWYCSRNRQWAAGIDWPSNPWMLTAEVARPASELLSKIHLKSSIRIGSPIGRLP